MVSYISAFFNFVAHIVTHNVSDKSLNEEAHSKRQTRGEEIEMCLDGGLEPIYYFSVFITIYI